MRLSAGLEGANTPERTPFSRRFAAGIITLYQRYVSPIKGFRCAHSALHGGPSCSVYIKECVTAEGVFQGWRQARARFAACHAASRTIQTMMVQNGSEDRSSADQPGKTETPEQRKERTKRCAVFTPATCCLTGFIFH